MKRLVIALILATSPVGFAQSTGKMPDQLGSETEKRITNLSKKFDDLLVSTPAEKALQAACSVNCDSATPQIREESRKAAEARDTAMDQVVSDIHAEVDTYISRLVDPKHVDLDRKLVEQGLKEILSHLYQDQPPYAFVLNSAKSRSLMVVYVVPKGVLMGEGATSVTVRAYNTTGSVVKLADFTGDDMDGYGNVSVKELHSSVSDETWLLVWGYMTGANGPNVRMRVYAYNGKKFRTMWMPANDWGTFTINVTDNGFTVDGPYYRENKERHDTYFLGPDGLNLTSSGK